MANKNTKRALLTSVMALVLCFTMLLGTTFAWFTDSVTSENNIIKAGNLDIVLEYYNGTEWKDVKDSSDILSGDLWEPGYVDVAYLRIKNAGSLALKYSLSVNIVSEKEGTNVEGKDFLLSDYIYYDVFEDQQPSFATREDAMKNTTETVNISSAYTKFDTLNANSEYKYLAMVVYMPTTVGNVANHNGTDIPEINLGISIFATQVDVEEDSFGADYDKDTGVVFSVDDANAKLALDEDVTLINCFEPSKVLYVPENYSGTLVLDNVAIASIQPSAPVSTVSTMSTATTLDPVNIVIAGDVVVIATEDEMSAVTGKALNITGNGTLTAIGKGKGAFGIGGLNTEYINIEGVHIADVRGGFVQPLFVNDTSYGKSEPEGGAAIGSAHSGAVINLTKVTIDNAQGGSKAAGIGARYHTGVTINITDSTIYNVEGGNASAGIGGSRVSDDVAPADQHVIINIKNSTVNAIGGQFGAGIGSGYDTHCGKNITETICTINIDATSKITAQGGLYAAGVGTGYHVAALAGNIECEVNATPGPSRTDKYTIAQGVGFGVVDHSREVKYVTSTPSITYTGEVIGVPDAPAKITYDAATMGSLYDTINGLNAGDTLIIPGGTYVTSGTFQVPAGVTLMGKEGETVIFHQSSSAQDNILACAGDVTIKNITFESNRKGYAIVDNTKEHNTDGDITVIDCTFVGIAAEKNWGIYKNLNGNLTVKNCTFENYNNALCGINNGNGSETVITGCTFTNINGEAIGYVTSTMPADFEADAIANNTGLTAENVIGY